jgi:hypothetical protein
VEGCGTIGQTLGDQLYVGVMAFAQQNGQTLGLRFDQEKKTFTIDGSANLELKQVESIVKNHVDKHNRYVILPHGRDDGGQWTLLLTPPPLPSDYGKRIFNGVETDEFMPTLEGKMETPAWASQGETVISDALHNDYLATFGLASCIAVVLYDPKSHTAMLSHIDDETKIDSFRTQARTMTKAIATLIGGDRTTVAMFENLKAELSSLGIPVQQTFIGGNKHRPTAIALNLKSGEVVDATGHYDSSSRAVRMAKSSVRSNKLHIRDLRT